MTVSIASVLIEFLSEVHSIENFESDEAVARMHMKGVLSPSIEFSDNFVLMFSMVRSVCMPVMVKSASSSGVGHLGFFSV